MPDSIDSVVTREGGCDYFANGLLDKTVYVTGGSRGLGQAIVRECASQGANVAFNYSRDEQGASQTLQMIEQSGREGMRHKVSSLEVQALEQSIADTEQQLGPVDILINNVGMSQPLPIALIESDDWNKVLQTNLTSLYNAVRAVLPGMIKSRSGVILNIGSLAGLRLIEALVHYSTTKAGVKGFTEALCKEVARYNIRVNCLAPGLLNDGVGQSLPQHRLEDYINHVALRRVGELTEVARLAAYLVSGRNSYMNGATLVMDGGF